MNTEKTPRQIAIDALTDKLTSMEAMQKYFHDRQMKKFSKIMRGLINDKTAELQILQNHFNPIVEVDVKELHIQELDKTISELKKEIERLSGDIKVNVELAKMREKLNEIK
jgi:uncharacterized small protein (DUF1192 family)